MRPLVLSVVWNVLGPQEKSGDTKVWNHLFQALWLEFQMTFERVSGSSKVQAGILSCVRWNEKLLVEQQELQVPRGVRDASSHANKRVSEESFPGARESAQFQGEIKSRVEGSASNPDYTQECFFLLSFS